MKDALATFRVTWLLLKKILVFAYLTFTLVLSRKPTWFASFIETSDVLLKKLSSAFSILEE